MKFPVVYPSVAMSTIYHSLGLDFHDEAELLDIETGCIEDEEARNIGGCDSRFYRTFTPIAMGNPENWDVSQLSLSPQPKSNKGLINAASRSYPSETSEMRVITHGHQMYVII